MYNSQKTGQVKLNKCPYLLTLFAKLVFTNLVIKIK